MPPLNEGDLLYMPTTLPGISVTKAREILQQTDRMIRQLPGGPSRLREDRPRRDRHRPGSALDDRDDDHAEAAGRVASGHDDPEAHRRARPDGPASGSHQRLDDAHQDAHRHALDRHQDAGRHQGGRPQTSRRCRRLGERIEAILRDEPGTLSVFAERVVGANYLDFEIDRREIARYGLTVADVQDVIQSAIGGRT